MLLSLNADRNNNLILLSFSQGICRSLVVSLMPLNLKVQGSRTIWGKIALDSTCTLTLTQRKCNEVLLKSWQSKLVDRYLSKLHVLLSYNTLDCREPFGLFEKFQKMRKAVDYSARTSISVIINCLTLVGNVCFVHIFHSINMALRDMCCHSI